MDPRLYMAACTGDVGTLRELLREDSLLLFKVTLQTSGSAGTPLHIAALLGHTAFAKLVMDGYPELSREPDQHGHSPIHLASSKGHLQIVIDMLNIDKELCLLKDSQGRTPLHCAAIKGRLSVISQLLSCCPESAREVTDRAETMLHLAVKNSHCELMVPLLSLLRELNLVDELVNCVDEDKNTVLHLAAARKHSRIIKILLKETKVNVNGVNSRGLTALDISVMSFSESDNIDIVEMIRGAQGQKERASDSQNIDPRQRTEHVQVNVDIDNSDRQANPSHKNPADDSPRSSRQSSATDAEVGRRELDSIKSGIIVLCSLFAAFCCNAILNPPGGLWHDRQSSNIINSTLAANGVKKFSKSSTCIFLLGALGINPTPDFNISTADLLGPNKAMSVTLDPLHFLNFLCADAVCFISSLVTIVIVMLTTSWNTLAPVFYMMTLVVIISAVILYQSVFALVTNEHFAAWALKVGPAPSFIVFVFYLIAVAVWKGLGKIFWGMICKVTVVLLIAIGWLIMFCFRLPFDIVKKLVRCCK